MIVNVAAAFFARGFLKNGTALLIASTPVNEEEPEENARKINATETPGTTAPGNAVAFSGCTPVIISNSPPRIKIVITAINVYTGIIKKLADSRSPRRFNIMIRRTIVMDMPT